MTQHAHRDPESRTLRGWSCVFVAALGCLLWFLTAPSDHEPVESPHGVPVAPFEAVPPSPVEDDTIPRLARETVSDSIELLETPLHLRGQVLFRDGSGPREFEVRVQAEDGTELALAPGAADGTWDCEVRRAAVPHAFTYTGKGRASCPVVLDDRV